MASRAWLRGFLALVGILVGTNAIWAADGEAEEAAIEAAQTWLGLVDAGDFDESWKSAATYFRNAVEQAQWERMMTSGRVPLGKLVSRRVLTARYETTLPGAPDGEYVVIQFESVFENKAEAIETVTPMRNGDGVWRVSGYFIK